MLTIFKVVHMNEQMQQESGLEFKVLLDGENAALTNVVSGNGVNEKLILVSETYRIKENETQADYLERMRQVIVNSHPSIEKTEKPISEYAR